MCFAHSNNVEKLKQICMLYALGMLLIFSTQAQATNGAIRMCAKAHIRILSLQSLHQIQKDLQGNRPLIAILRGAKKNSDLEATLIELIRSMPDSLNGSLLQNTGYEIVGGRLVLQKEVKSISRDWTSAFVNQTLEALKAHQTKDVPRDPGAPPKIKVLITSISSTKHLETINYFTRYALDHILTKKDNSWLRHSKFFKELRHLFSTEESSFYYLLETKLLLDGKNMRAYFAEGDMTADQAAFIYNQAIQKPGAFTGADVIQGRLKYIEMVENFVKYAKETSHQLVAEQARTIEEKRHLKPQLEIKKGLAQKSTSIRELIEELNPSEAEIISKQLIELIQSVNSSGRQKSQIQSALQSEKPQLKLLELAYILKQHDELTQKEIQSTVFAALEEITKPETAAFDSESTTSENPQPESHFEARPTKIPVESFSVKGSTNRIEQLKHRLFESSLSSGEPFTISIHNQKEFFEVLKPGTAGFNRLEADPESMKQKFVRAIRYFTGNGSQEILPGDGHFGRFNHQIFSLRWGEYRLLVTAEKSASGPDHLVVLCTYHKSDTNDAHKEDQFYQLAEKRMLQRGHSF